MNFILAPSAISDLEAIFDCFFEHNFYRVSPESVEIVRIVDARRNLLELFKGLK
jgi:plasmid stabilization system protein ParE